MRAGSIARLPFSICTLGKSIQTSPANTPRHCGRGSGIISISAVPNRACAVSLAILLGCGWMSFSSVMAEGRSLDPSIERNMKLIPRKQRAMVRKGMRNQLRTELDDGVDRLHRVYSESVRNLGTPVFAKSYFEILRKEFAERSDIVTVIHKGRAVASVLTSIFGTKCFRFMGAVWLLHGRLPPTISCIGR